MRRRRFLQSPLMIPAVLVAMAPLQACRTTSAIPASTTTAPDALAQLEVSVRGALDQLALAAPDLPQLLARAEGILVFPNVVAVDPA